jgi:hypothetical protein
MGGPLTFGKPAGFCLHVHIKLCMDLYNLLTFILSLFFCTPAPH